MRTIPKHILNPHLPPIISSNLNTHCPITEQSLTSEWEISTSSPINHYDQTNPQTHLYRTITHDLIFTLSLNTLYNTTTIASNFLYHYMPPPTVLSLHSSTIPTFHFGRSQITHIRIIYTSFSLYSTNPDNAQTHISLTTQSYNLSTPRLCTHTH